MKTKRKFFILIVLILLLALIWTFIQIYAKYLTSVSGSTDVAIAQWNIKVNNLSIKTHPDISSTIQPVFPGNDYIAQDIIAPTAEGYFDLNLDFTNADVSFKYEIKTSVSQTSPVQDLVAYRIFFR